jgi:hypothetical protein
MRVLCVDASKAVAADSHHGDDRTVASFERHLARVGHVDDADQRICE